MSLLLDRTQVQGHNLKVSANLKIESENLGGQTSGTDSAHKGFKPKTLTVSLQIKFKQKEQLTSLVQLAQNVEKSGKRKIYRIVNDTAAAFGVKQCQFSDNFSAREDDSLKQWQIQFVLTEYDSTAEKTEQRQTAAAGAKVNTQGTNGEKIESEEGESNQLTGLEKVLKKADEAVGKVL